MKPSSIWLNPAKLNTVLYHFRNSRSMLSDILLMDYRMVGQSHLQTWNQSLQKRCSFGSQTLFLDIVTWLFGCHRWHFFLQSLKLASISPCALIHYLNIKHFITTEDFGSYWLSIVSNFIIWQGSRSEWNSIWHSLSAICSSRPGSCWLRSLMGKLAIACPTLHAAIGVGSFPGSCRK